MKKARIFRKKSEIKNPKLRPRRWDPGLDQTKISGLALSVSRVSVLCEIMNVTLKLSDELCKLAKHRAIDELKSLSKRVAEIVEREISKTQEKPKAKTRGKAPKVPDQPGKSKIAHGAA